MARLKESRRYVVRNIIPPRKCRATTSAGNPCPRPAIVGAAVCYHHGGNAPQVRAAAERRVTLAEALVTGDRRPAWEVLEDGLHIVDLVMREVILQVKDEGTVTPAMLDKLIASVERAHRLAKVNLDAGIDQRRLKLAEAQAGQMHRVFSAVLSGLHLTPEQRALVPGLLKREIEGVLTAKAITA